MPFDNRQRSAIALAAGLFGIAAIVAVAAYWQLRSAPPLEPTIVQASPIAAPAPQTAEPAAQPTQPVDIPLGPQRVARSAARTNAPPVSSAPAETVVPAAVEHAPAADRASAPPMPAIADKAVSAPVPAQPVGTYSALDPGVTPPEAVRRDLGFQRLAVRPDEIVRIELLVNEVGRVDSAKVQNDSETIADTMLYAMALQAIRSWEFYPAMKAGTPVRYRQLLVLRGSGEEVAAEK